MKSKLLLAAARAGAVAGRGLRQATPARLAAVADKGRPEADTKRDADRKPAEMLEFAGIKPGGQPWPTSCRAAAIFTRIFAKAVGPKARCWRITNPPPANATTPPAIIGIAADPQYGNIHPGLTGIGSFKCPSRWTCCGRRRTTTTFT
jgi:predicted methyltransferase